MTGTFLKTALAGAVSALLAATATAQVFTISDIRVEGIQRTEPGTVFSHLPFRVGDEYNPERGAEAIHQLYSSGLFRDIDLSVDGTVLVVNVIERPAVAAIETNGIKAFDKDGVEKSLREVGLSEGRIFDHSILERADQELRRQYLSQGYYGVDIKTSATPLERNRVRITINVDEGSASSIKQIRFVGNTVFDSDDLADQMQLAEHKWSSFYTKRDLYSREKLAADLETLRSFYQNQGYLDFKIDSVQVSVAPNKSDIFITINVTEGKQYTVNDITLGGDMLGLESEVKPLVVFEKGEVYNAERIQQMTKSIVDKYSALGYAFATVTPMPVPVEGQDAVNVVLTVDPGRRAYVRHVNITGNTRTRDDVIRREVRQYESAWFDSEKVKVSRDRIDRLGYFEMVTAEPKPVEGTRDQVDLEINVKERPTGSISLGAGYSTSDGVILSAGFAQDNVFGSGKSFSIEVNTSKSMRTYAMSLAEPYITPEGISRHIDLYDRRVDLDELDVSNVAYETIGAGLSFGVPVTELDRVFLGARLEQTKVDLRGNYTGAMTGDSDNNSPVRYWDYVDEYGDAPKAALLTLGWSRDSRDNVLAPTRGRYQRLSAEFALPVWDQRYYRASYQFTQYLPLSKSWTLGVNMQLGYGDTYGDKMFPFFKNFYAGGIGSVRGFETSSIGPRDTGDRLGGDRQAIFSAELLTPLPGADRTLRGLIFFDAGAVWGYRREAGSTNYYREDMDFGEMRYSVGFGVAWISPLGPLKFSLAFPLNKKDEDETQRFQFQIGTGF